jgi:hypothetical protein
MKKAGAQFIRLLFAILPFQPLIAQNPNTTLEVAKMRWQAKQVVPPSPDAAELGKYGNVPVSLYTGTPTISIPFFELKGNSLSVPISLSYNASGYKPEDAASWVGSGWALNAGGVITRSVMGNPDNSSNYFGVANLLNAPTEVDIEPFYYYVKDIQDGTKETQPDVYYYNFNGHSGKFIIRPDYTIAKAQKDLKLIDPCFSGCLQGFRVVDEQGITYVFEDLEQTTMFPYDAEGQQGLYYQFNSAWYLTKMYSADGVDTITFEYHSTTNGQWVYQNMLSNQSYNYTYGYKQQSSCFPTIVEETPISTYFPPSTNIKRKFLSRVTQQKGTDIVAYVEVVSSTGQRLDTDFQEDRLVNQLKLYSRNNGTDKIITQYNFSYGYFTNLQNVMYKRRLRLESVQQISTDLGTLSPPAYVFSYNSSFSLPERFTASLDHWGFYNAQLNSSLVPNVGFAGETLGQYYFQPRNVGGGANREASIEGSSATLLNKIQYPTGGYTTFEYELNRAKVGNAEQGIGGVRIKQIIDHSFTNKQATVKNYTYLLDDGTSSGVIGMLPDYRTNSSYHHYHTPLSLSPGTTCEEINEYSEYDLYTINVSANSIFGLGTFQGSHIGYSQVTESQVDLATNQPLGKMVYKYFVGEYFEHNEDIGSGDLLEQTVYRNDNKILEQTTSTYQYSVDLDIEAKVVKANNNQTNKTYYCKLSANNYFNYGEWEDPSPDCITAPINFPTKSHLETYTIFVQNKQLTQNVHKVYDQLSNSYLTTTKNFTYGNTAHNYPTLIEEITSNGDKVKTAIKYVIDYASAPGASPGTPAYNIDMMRQKNMISLPVEKLQYRQDANGSNTRFINGQLTDYIFGSPSRIYFLEAKPLLTSVTNSSISSSTLNYDNHYRLAATINYDNLMNLRQQSKTNDAAKSYIWDYSNVYPIAEVTGATSDQIFYTSFECNGTDGFNFSGSPVAGATITGKRYYDLSGGSISATVNSAVVYTLSYWRNSNTGPYTVSGSTNYRQGSTKNGWTYYEHQVTGVSTTTVSGSGNIDELRLYPASAQMTTQTFEPLIGVTSQCGPNSQLLYYEYDGLNRLVNVRDDDCNIVKNYRYNYGLGTAPAASAQTLFYNASISQNYTKTGCATGTFGDVVTYTVPYGKFVSAVSQADVNAKAAADLAANGQAYANSVGACRWYSASKHVQFFKNNCSYEQGPGNSYYYDVPFGTYRSVISQADADAQAQADVDANGQAAANRSGDCSCTAEGYRYINGACEAGQLHHGSSVQLPDGTWECAYYFTFTDGYVTGYYYYNSSDPCPIDN